MRRITTDRQQARCAVAIVVIVRAIDSNLNFVNDPRGKDMFEKAITPIRGSVRDYVV